MKKFTLIDVLIIIAVVGVMIFGVFFLTSRSVDTNGSVEFVVLVAEREAGMSDSMQIGDSVVLSYTEKYTGKLTDIKIQPSHIMAYDSNNTQYKVQDSYQTEDTYITIKADVDISENLISLGDAHIRVGEFIPVRGKGYATGGYIVEVKSETEQIIEE